MVAEYALRGVASPTGVAEYRVTDATDALPAELRAALPSRRHAGGAAPAAHSSRSETTGSTSAARRAGTQQASAAAETSSAHTPAYVGRSSDVTP